MVFIRFRHKLHVLGICLVVLVGFNLKSSYALDFDSNCALFEGEILIEQSHCKTTILKSSSGVEEGGNLTNYQWANGRVIVTQNVEQFFTINGDEGQTEFTKDGFDLCVKSLIDNKTFCTGSLESTKTTTEPANKMTSNQTPRLYSKYADWVDFAWCEVSNQDDYSKCRTDITACLQNNEIGTFICPELGICSYSSKGELKSKSACLLKHNSSANGKAWIGDYKWQNGNRLELVEFEENFLMNDVSVTELKSSDGRCYFTEGNAEKFCFKQNEDFRFKGGLADFTQTGGFWVSEGTTCTNRLYPFDGGVGIFENSFYNKEPSLYYWYDDINKAERMGVEANSCHVFDIIKTGKGIFTGNFKCGGEAIEYESEAGIDRANGTMVIKVKPYEELLLIKHGETERYVQCQG